ncbi:MAG: VCBS repeat-containing protein [Verrucomicrobia bacterium]|nr:VCBS repeat-containing protein [Verrucomicrobiota bacterium]
MILGLQRAVVVVRSNGYGRLGKMRLRGVFAMRVGSRLVSRLLPVLLVVPVFAVAIGAPSIDSVTPVSGTELMSADGCTYEVSSTAALSRLVVDIAVQGSNTWLSLDMPFHIWDLKTYHREGRFHASHGIVALGVSGTSMSATWSIDISTRHPAWQRLLNGALTTNVTFSATAYDTLGASAVVSRVYALTSSSPADYDYDGMGDKALHLRGGSIRWLRSSTADSPLTTEVVEGATALAGDLDGDGLADRIWFKEGDDECEWNVILSSVGGTPQTFYFGTGRGCIPFIGDFDGDGIDDPGVQRQNGLQSYWRSSVIENWLSGAVRPTVGGTAITRYGDRFCVPAVGDYDGDGRCDSAWFRAGSIGSWYIARSSAGWKEVSFVRESEAKPAPGDYDGDGKTDLAVRLADNRLTWRESSKAGTGLRRTMPPNSDPSLAAWRRFFKDATFAPTDYNGDGITDPTWVRVTADNRAQWFHRLSRLDGDTVRYMRVSPVWGPATAKPVLATSAVPAPTSGGNLTGFWSITGLRGVQWLALRHFGSRIQGSIYPLGDYISSGTVQGRSISFETWMTWPDLPPEALWSGTIHSASRMTGIVYFTGSGEILSWTATR